MDELTANLGLGEISLVLAWVVGATVFLVQKLKWIITKRWTVASWIWLAASILIPGALVVLVCQQWAQDLINPMLPEQLRLSLDPSAALPTAFTAALGSNGAYTVAKRLGMVKDYSQSGNDTTQPGNVPQVRISGPAIQGSATTENNALLVMQVDPPARGPAYYVWDGARLLPVQTTKETDG